MDPEKDFFTLKSYAVVGVSTDETKFGRMVFDRFRKAGMNAYPVNPRYEEVAGARCYPSLSKLPEVPEGVSVVVPPAVTLEVAKEAAGIDGVKIVWMQPGTEHPEAVKILEDAGKAVVHGGPCVLVAMARMKK